MTRTTNDEVQIVVVATWVIRSGKRQLEGLW